MEKKNDECTSPGRPYELNKNDYEDLSCNQTSIGNNSRSSIGGCGSTTAAQSWRNVRAVMAYYCTLRKIKRNGFI